MAFFGYSGISAYYNALLKNTAFNLLRNNRLVRERLQHIMTSISNGQPTPFAIRQPKDIECWGHRGASAHLPENT